MSVRIDEPGDKGAAVEIEHPRLGTLMRGHLVKRSDRDDPSVLHRDGVRLGLIVVDRQDRAARIKRVRNVLCEGGIRRHNSSDKNS